MRLPWRKPPIAEVERAAALSFDEFANYFSFNGVDYPLSIFAPRYSLGSPGEEVSNSFSGFVQGIYKSNGVVFACIAARARLFSEARFQFRQMRNGRPGDLFGTQALGPLETPWPNGTTGDLLLRMIQDVDLGGNSFIVRGDRRLMRLHPEWTTVIAGSKTSDNPNAPDVEPIGYIYEPGGKGRGDAIHYLPEQVAHWAPTPDPLARFLGMSWLTPVVREIQADSAAMTHKLQFFRQGATPNLAITMDPDITPETFERYVELHRQNSEGVANAYKCLHPDTDVAMWDGRRLPARDVRPGDEVVAWADGRAVPGRISHAEWQPPSPIVTVTTQRGRVIKTNDRHPFLVKDGRWVDAKDLAPGDLLQVGLGWGSETHDSLTARKAWMLGVLVGDGCFVSTTPVLSAAEPSIRERANTIGTLVRAGKGHDYRVKGIAQDVRVAGLFGKRSWEKRVPDSVMRGSAAIRASFISGLIDADGHITDPEARRSAEVGITSTSADLLRDVQHMLASLGVNASVSCSMPAGPHGRTRAAWRLSAFGNDQARRLAAFLDLAHVEKGRRLAVYAGRSSAQDRSRVDRIVSVEVSAPETTIGLEVADHHTHVTGGVVTHNTLFVAGGTTIQPVGADMKQIDFKTVQGHGETRIASAAGVPPIIVGLSEGLEAATYSNYGQARRAFADGTMRPLWRSVCGSLAKLVQVPAGADLWYDDRDISFLQEDQADAANIQAVHAGTIHTLIAAGFEPSSVIDAVTAGDMTRLVHTGMYSVQLQPAGTLTEGKGAVVQGVPKQIPAKTGQSSAQDVLEALAVRGA